MDTRTSPFRLRITQLREVLAALDLHALLVPSSDPHLSEYLPERWQGRQWLSGFTGSMGTLVVTLDRAVLFADSRYWAQAQNELEGTGIELEKIATSVMLAHVDWLARHVPRGSTVAVDGQVLGLASAKALQAALDGAGVLLRSDVDLLDAIWPDRAGLPAAPIYEHKAPHASQLRSAKLELVRAAMARQGATHHFISTVDDLAWLTNLRGNDVPYNPVFLAHLLLDAQGGTLFVDALKLAPELVAKLAADGLRIAPYDQAGSALAALGADDTLLIDPKRITHGLRRQLGAQSRVVEAINPSTLLKSRKTAQEAAFVREAMAEDGAAMCEFYAAFEAALAARRAGTVGAGSQTRPGLADAGGQASPGPAGAGEPISELTIDAQLSAQRARRSGFMGLSFGTIAAFNANGAMPHYRATEASHALIEGDGLLLIDSGGQYLGGTTDITRVWPVGEVSAAMKRDYTLVLKGTIALSRARFPRGTASPMLDALARAPLWAEGIEYGHGTGHGVGYFLNVHEGPQSISKAVPDVHMGMEPGMITSIEPGVYRPGRWGVRIENLVLAVPAVTSEHHDGGEGFGEFLEFETLTLCPIDTRCIEPTLLRDDEVTWLNAYHATVLERLTPRVGPAALQWLQQRTQHFSR